MEKKTEINGSGMTIYGFPPETTVTIPVSVWERLIRNDEKLEVIVRMIEGSPYFAIDDVKSILGLKA